MNLALNDEQRTLIDTLRRFTKEVLQPLEDRIEKRRLARARHRARRAREGQDARTLRTRLRKQFGRRIGDFQMVQQVLADSVIEINAAQLMVLHAAWMIDAGLDTRDWIAIQGARLRRARPRVADCGVPVLGGMGFWSGVLQRARRASPNPAPPSLQRGGGSNNP